MPDSPAELFRCHHLAVFRYIQRMTGRADAAEDLTQEVFVRVLRSWDTYDQRGQERAWLFRIARNLAIDWHRAKHREAVGHSDPAALAVDSTQDVDTAVQEALDGLPVDDRDVFLLRVLGGFGHEEIADLIGTSPAAVRSRIFRARNALRSRLSGVAWGRACHQRRVES